MKVFTKEWSPKSNGTALAYRCAVMARPEVWICGKGAPQAQFLRKESALNDHMDQCQMTSANARVPNYRVPVNRYLMNGIK